MRDGSPPLVIGHRGASGSAPENTLEAFAACWSAGVHWVETDVQPSADLVPVLFHDDALERTSSGTGALRSKTLVELAALDAGSWFGGPPARIPTLHGLLTALPMDGRVLLEIKGPHSPAALITELAVIRATGRTAHVWLQSFETEVLAELGEAIPGGWRGLLRDAVDPDPVGLCRELGVSSYNLDWASLLANPGIIGPLHAAGVSVITYTANQPEHWAELTALRVDGIITDQPAELLAWQRRTV